MGLLIDGNWQDEPPEGLTTGGVFIRRDSQFRHWVTPDGDFPAEAGRYHLYVSLACPWAHRTMIVRSLKGLAGIIGVSVVHWLMGRDGWSFEPGEGVIPDPVLGARHMHEIYTASDSAYSGRATVPVLWDKVRRCIVNNESSEIMRMFNSAFDGLGAHPLDLYPPALRAEIDAVNARIYETLNNGVYKAGFATSQAAYDAAVTPLFETLEWLEARLGRSRYLCGSVITEADWRLFTTLIRFDPVYAGHFKCDRRRIVDHPNLWGWLRELYQWPGLRETVDFGHIRRHYYQSHRNINPSGIVPVGPALDHDAPHGRG